MIVNVLGKGILDTAWNTYITAFTIDFPNSIESPIYLDLFHKYH